MNIILLIIYILTTSSGLILLKLGSNSGALISIVNNSIKLNFAPMSILGLLFYATSFLLYTYLVSKFNLGFLVPLTTAFVYIIIFVASFLLFNETFTTLKIFAISLILIGITLLNIYK